MFLIPGIPVIFLSPEGGRKRKESTRGKSISKSLALECKALCHVDVTLVKVPKARLWETVCMHVLRVHIYIWVFHRSIKSVCTLLLCAIYTISTYFKNCNRILWVLNNIFDVACDVNIVQIYNFFFLQMLKTYRVGTIHHS